MTPYLEEKLMGTLFGEPYAAPDLWIGLTDAGVECTGANYSRVRLKDSLSRKPATNTKKIEFPISMGDWGTVDGAGIYDSPRGGNYLWPCAIPLQRVTGSRRVVIMPGQLRLSLRKETSYGN